MKILTQKVDLHFFPTTNSLKKNKANRKTTLIVKISSVENK